MAQMPDRLKVSVEADTSAFEAAVTRFRRRAAGLTIAVELAAKVQPADVDDYLHQFAPPTKGRETQDARWVAEHRGDWERMVADGIAWLIAADEYTAALEAAQTSTED